MSGIKLPDNHPWKKFQKLQKKQMQDGGKPDETNETNIDALITSRLKYYLNCNDLPRVCSMIRSETGYQKIFDHVRYLLLNEGLQDIDSALMFVENELSDDIRPQMKRYAVFLNLPGDEEDQMFEDDSKERALEKFQQWKAAHGDHEVVFVDRKEDKDEVLKVNVPEPEVKLIIPEPSPVEDWKGYPQIEQTEQTSQINACYINPPLPAPEPVAEVSATEIMGLKSGLTISQVAVKHGVDVMLIERELDKGEQVEMEHTDDKLLARRIALDHLAERPDYYTILSVAEKQPRVFAEGGEVEKEYNKIKHLDNRGASVKEDVINLTAYTTNAEAIARHTGVNVEKVQQILSEAGIKKSSGGWMDAASSRSARMKNIKKFLDKFPDHPKDWSQATDELADLHNRIAEDVPNYKGNTFVSAGGTLPDEVRKDPGLRNREHKQRLIKLFHRLNDDDFNKNYDENKEWFEGNQFSAGGNINDKSKSKYDWQKVPKAPGYYTMGPYDSEKPMYTERECTLIEQGKRIRYEYNADRMDKAKALAHLKEIQQQHPDAELVYSWHEYGGSWRIYSKDNFASGGKMGTSPVNISSPVKIIVKSKHGPTYDDIWYLRKIDGTHLSMSNNPDTAGALSVMHIGQLRGKSYYNDVERWLGGAIFSEEMNGREYKDFYRQGGKTEVSEFDEDQALVIWDAAGDKGYGISNHGRFLGYEDELTKAIQRANEERTIMHRPELPIWRVDDHGAYWQIDRQGAEIAGTKGMRQGGSFKFSEGGTPRFSATFPFMPDEPVLDKKFNVMYNVGHSKYVINSYDGIKKHPDGSPFYDIDIFSNKKDFERAQKKLLAEGYKYAYAYAEGGAFSSDTIPQGWMIQDYKGKDVRSDISDAELIALASEWAKQSFSTTDEAARWLEDNTYLVFKYPSPEENERLLREHYRYQAMNDDGGGDDNFQEGGSVAIPPLQPFTAEAESLARKMLDKWTWRNGKKIVQAVEKKGDYLIALAVIDYMGEPEPMLMWFDGTRIHWMAMSDRGRITLQEINDYLSGKIEMAKGGLLWDGNIYYPTGVNIPLAHGGNPPREEITTLMHQIGRPAFVMMGAKNMVYDNSAISLRWKMGGGSKWQYVTVKYNPGSDLYDLTFTNVRERIGYEPKITTLEVKDVHIEDLHATIEAQTGFYLKMAEGGTLDRSQWMDPKEWVDDDVFTEQAARIGQIKQKMLADPILRPVAITTAYVGYSPKEYFELEGRPMGWEESMRPLERIPSKIYNFFNTEKFKTIKKWRGRTDDKSRNTYYVETKDGRFYEIIY